MEKIKVRKHLKMLDFHFDSLSFSRLRDLMGSWEEEFPGIELTLENDNAFGLRLSGLVLESDFEFENRKAFLQRELKRKEEELCGLRKSLETNKNK